MRQATDQEERDETEYRGRESQREVLRQLAAMDECWCFPWRVCDRCRRSNVNIHSVAFIASQAVRKQGIGDARINCGDMAVNDNGSLPTISLRVTASSHDNSIATLAELLESMADELRRAAKQEAK